MRIELRKIIELDYGYSIHDFDHAFQVAKKLDNDKYNGTMRRQAEILKEQPDSVEELMDDVHWHSHLEGFLIWHFALWRLQAIFEAYIVENFLDKSYKKGGLSKKLTGLKKNDYYISDENFTELIEWGQVRNALSHSPPSAYVNGILEESDVKEYLDLCKGVVTDLDDQKQRLIQNSDTIP